jgi:methylase of polypeptide subunit release factors
VLDMGTGSGVNAILAASKAIDVVAVDINPVGAENRVTLCDLRVFVDQSA